MVTGEMRRRQQRLLRRRVREAVALRRVAAKALPVAPETGVPAPREEYARDVATG